MYHKLLNKLNILVIKTDNIYDLSSLIYIKNIQNDIMNMRFVKYVVIDISNLKYIESGSIEMFDFKDIFNLELVFVCNDDKITDVIQFISRNILGKDTVLCKSIKEAIKYFIDKKHE